MTKIINIIQVFSSIRISIHTVLLALLISTLYSCNSTRRLTKDEFLLGKVIVDIDNPTISREELIPYLKTKPNKKIFGARFHLGVYNLAKPDKNNWWNNWLREIGEKPVLYNPVLRERTENEFERYLQNSGYFNTRVSSEVHYKNKKAIVNFTINTNAPFTINQIRYQIIDTAIQEEFYSDTINTLLKRNDVFDLQLMDQERTRVETYMKENGYFGFTKNAISFEADSNLPGNKINLDYIIEPTRNTGNSKPESHKKYNINNVYIHTNYNRRLIYQSPEKYFNELDTIARSKNLYLLYFNKINIKPNSVLQSNYIIPGNQYRLSDIEKTYRVFNSLPIVRLTDIELINHEHVDSSGKKLIDCNINLSLNTKHSYTLDSEVSLSGGDFGAGGSFSYKNKNLFKGAETFNIRLFGEVESIKERTSDTVNNYISDYGVEASLTIPKFILPVSTTGYEKRYNPTTQFTLGINQKNLGFLTSNVSNFSLQYSWRGNQYLRHILKPLDLYYVKADLTDDGKALIVNFPDQSRFTSHAVIATAYSLIYSNQTSDNYHDFWYYRHNFETAGNILSLYHNLAGDTLGELDLFGQNYAQYFKSDFDLRYYQVINSVNTVIYRLNVGAAVPYGNSADMPDEKLFSSGGPSSNRGWKQYKVYPDTVAQNIYPLFYKGDIKLEANIEYRFDLVWLLKGALFADAGNVWRISTYSTKDAEFNFRFDRFYKQLAVAGGFGIRLDLNYFIARLDLGVRIIDPLLPAGEKFTLSYNNYPISELLKFNFGIGYPF